MYTISLNFNECDLIYDALSFEHCPLLEEILHDLNHNRLHLAPVQVKHLIDRINTYIAHPSVDALRTRIYNRARVSLFNKVQRHMSVVVSRPEQSL